MAATCSRSGEGEMEDWMGTDVKRIEGFAYDELSTDAQEQVRSRTKTIRLAERRTIKETVRIALALLEVRQLLPSDKVFGAWRRQETPVTAKTVERLMNVARLFKQRYPDIVSDQDALPDLDVPPTVLYLLAEPHVPAEVTDGILAQAARGERVTVTTVRALLAPTRSPGGQTSTVAGPGEHVALGAGEDDDTPAPAKVTATPSESDGDVNPDAERIGPSDQEVKASDAEAPARAILPRAMGGVPDSPVVQEAVLEAPQGSTAALGPVAEAILCEAVDPWRERLAAAEHSVRRLLELDLDELPASIQPHDIVSLKTVIERLGRWVDDAERRQTFPVSVAP